MVCCLVHLAICIRVCPQHQAILLFEAQHAKPHSCILGSAAAILPVVLGNFPYGGLIVLGCHLHQHPGTLKHNTPNI